MMVVVLVVEGDDFLDEEEIEDLQLGPEDQQELDDKNEDYRKFYKDVYREVGDQMEYQSLLLESR